MKTVSVAAVSLILSLGWVGFLAYCLVSGQTPEHLKLWLGGAPLILCIALAVRPQMTAPLIFAVWGAAILSGLASAALYLHLLTPGQQGPFLTQMGLYAIVSAMALVSRWAYLKWPLATSRRTRTLIATAFVACMGIGVAVFAGFVMASNGADWHSLIDHWDVTLIVLYLPLMLVAGLAFASWRSAKTRRKL